MASMTRDETIAALSQIAHELDDNRLTIVRQIITARGEVIKTLRHTVHLRDSRTSEPHSQGERR